MIGILYGPWLPVYGTSIIVIVLIDKFLKRLKLNKLLEIVLFGILCFIILTILEFIGGSLIEIIFGKIYWNYTDLKFNIGKYISLEISAIWTVFAILINYLLLPRIKKYLVKIPLKLGIALCLAFLVDVVLTFVFAI